MSAVGIPGHGPRLVSFIHLVPDLVLCPRRRPRLLNQCCGLAPGAKPRGHLSRKGSHSLEKPLHLYFFLPPYLLPFLPYTLACGILVP